MERSDMVVDLNDVLVALDVIWEVSESNWNTNVTHSIDPITGFVPSRYPVVVEEEV